MDKYCSYVTFGIVVYCYVDQLLIHYTWFPEYTNRHKGTSSTNGLNNFLNMNHSQNGFHSSLNALNLNSSISATNGNHLLNNSWSSSPSGNRCTATHGNGWIGQYCPFRLRKRDCVRGNRTVH